MIFFRLFPLLMLFVLLGRSVEAREVVQVGWWSQYAERITNAQVAHHGFSFDEDKGFIAALDCSLVGEYAWIKVNDSDWFRVRVFDCLGAGGDPSWWRDNHILGEIDYYTAEKHGVAGLGGVRAHLAFERDLGNLSDSENSVWAIPINASPTDLEVIDNNIIESKSLSRSIFNDFDTVGNVSAPSIPKGEYERHANPFSVIFPTYGTCSGPYLPAYRLFIRPPFTCQNTPTPTFSSLFVGVPNVDIEIVGRRGYFDLYYNLKQVIGHIQHRKQSSEDRSTKQHYSSVSNFSYVWQVYD